MTNIYIKNIPLEITSQNLEALFQQYGTVTLAQIIFDRHSGYSRGFGFVEMNDDTEAHNSISNLNGSLLLDQVLQVLESKPEVKR